MKTYYDIDTMPRDDIERIQGQLLEETVRHAFGKSPYYRRLLDDAGLKASDIKRTDDLTKLPLTGREDVQKSNREFFAAAGRDMSEFVSTTGTTGEPIYIGMTAGDLDRLAYNEEKSFLRAGATRDDVFLIDVTCDNLFIAGMAYYSGLVRLGAAVVRAGPRDIARQFDLMKKLMPTGIVAVPSFLARMARQAQEHNVRLNEYGIERIVLIGDSVRNEDFSLNPLGELLARTYGNIFYSTYGITEGQVSFCECTRKNGLHCHPDLIMAEIVDESGRQLPDGQAGELVLTTLQIEGMPLLRYCTGDITFKISDTCGCGRNSLRIGPVLGRKRHRLKFKGVTLYPKTIENAILDTGDVVNYQIEVFTGDDHTDQVLLRVGSERSDSDFKMSLLENLRSKARVSPVIEILTPEEVAGRIFPKGSRKPVTFLDRRETGE